MISKKKYLLADLNILWSKEPLKNANVLANDFKQFLASCHVQQVNNLYVFIIMIFIDSDSYRYLEYFTIH